MINWEAGSTKWKVIGAVGMVAMAVLALVVIGAYYPNPASNALANALHLRQVVTKTVYVNNTVVKYINQTVPVYINRTVYVNQTVVRYVYVNGTSPASLMNSPAGNCSGSLVVLPNATAWFVVACLIPTNANIIQPIMLWPPTHINNATHYVQVAALSWMAFVGGLPNPVFFNAFKAYCYMNNVTLPGNYYLVVCGDTNGEGPLTYNLAYGYVVYNKTTGTLTIVDNELTFAPSTGAYDYSLPNIVKANTTYYGMLVIEVSNYTNRYYYLVPAEINMTYVPNPQAALYMPIIPLKYAELWYETDEEVYGTLSHPLSYYATALDWVWR